MNKTIIGIDIGASEFKFAACGPSEVHKLAVEPVPDKLVRDGQIVSMEAMSAFLREAAGKHHIRRGRCAVVLPSQLAFVRRTVMPVMTTDQLLLNLPYEFRDFITQEKDKYFYDYAVLGTQQGENSQPEQLELLAAAALKSTIREYSVMLRRAGFKLAVAAPEEFAYANLIRLYEQAHPKEAGAERCILDLGHTSTRIHIFTGHRFEATRVVDYGGAMVDNAIADAFHVDEHIAKTYKLSNHNGGLDLEACLGIYRAVSVDIMRAINFYSYNNPGSGGSCIEQLTAQLQDALGLHLRPISELIPFASPENAALPLCPTAVGITQQ